MAAIVKPDLDPSLDRFNTWDSDHPTEVVCPTLGLRIGFAAYSNRASRFTRFAAPLDGVRLGPRTIHGEHIHLELELAGTRLALALDCVQPYTVTGRWRVISNGEWGLRFWPIVWFEWRTGASGGARVNWHYDGDTGSLSAALDEQHAFAQAERTPLLMTFHDSIDALGQELNTEGYWYLASRGTAGAVAAMRFNLEEMPSSSFALAVAGDRHESARAARAALDSAAQEPPSLHEGVNAGSLDAVRDVIAWNTVFDTVNRRRYTALSRNWTATKFGGFGVWLDDVLYHALMAGLFDLDLARDNLEAVLAHATEAGNLPCLVTGRDAWIDRSQPPIGAFVVWMLYLRWQDERLLQACFEPLLANHEWWWRLRDGNDNGLLEYGTSPVGDGLYRGTKLAAKDESSMDNSPTHDEASLVTSSWTLDCEDVGLNSLVALDGEMLALIARELGDDATAQALEARTTELKDRISTNLWDSERQVFANRLWSGKFVSAIAPTSFYPLLAGAASAAQSQAMLSWLEREDGFGGPFTLPSVTRADPAYPDNVYWRGRVWPPLNFLTYYALRRNHFDTEADNLAQRSLALFEGQWRTRRICAENFNAETGEADDQPDTDTFYGWGALMPWLGVATLCDVTPWRDFEINFDGRDLRLGPVRCPFGALELESVEGILTLTLDGDERLRTDVRGCISITSLSEDTFSGTWIGAPARAEGSIRLWIMRAPFTARATEDGAPVDLTRFDDGVRLQATAGTTTVQIKVEPTRAVVD